MRHSLNGDTSVVVEVSKTLGRLLLLVYCSALVLHRTQGVGRATSSSQGWRERKKRAIVITTWPFTEATHAAWGILAGGGVAKSAIVAGCSACERLQCDGTVGFGGSPDDQGNTSLDALLMDGDSMDVGAVANLRMTRDAIEAARLVLELTNHSILAGNEASDFATRLGLPRWDTLATNASIAEYETWKLNNCQPNFYRHGTVCPDPASHCGPFHPESTYMSCPDRSLLDNHSVQSHDTISMIALDMFGSSACGSSTNGLKHKIAGRVGDAAIPGGGCYADSQVGACAATGDGDIHVRFLPCFQAVENMRRGLSAQEASDDAMRRIVDRLGHHTSFQGAIVTYDISNDQIGSSRVGEKFNFSYTYRTEDGLHIVHVPPLDIDSVTKK